MAPEYLMTVTHVGVFTYVSEMFFFYIYSCHVLVNFYLRLKVKLNKNTSKY